MAHYSIGKYRLAYAAALPALLFAAPATAELPDPVRDMLIAAMETKDHTKVITIAEIAKKTNPHDKAVIDAIIENFLEEHAKKLAAATNDREAAAKSEAILSEAQNHIIAATKSELDRLAMLRNRDFFANWSGQSQIGAFRSTGKTDATGISLGLKLEREGETWLHKLRSNGEYQRSDGRTSRQQFSFAYEGNKKIGERFYSYGLAQFEHDHIQGFDARYALSGGVGYHIETGGDRQISVKSGLAWRQTNFHFDKSEADTAALAALEMTWRLSDVLRLSEDASAFIQSGNSTFESQTGLEALLAKKLSARFAYILKHNTSPPLPAIKTDTLTRFTLIYDF